MGTQVEERFTEYYGSWIHQLEEIMHALLRVSKERGEFLSEVELKSLVSKVTAHVKEYYTVKWAAAREDVLVFFSQRWLNPMESAYSWVTGWKPSIAFRLLNSLRKLYLADGSSMMNMSEEQERKIEELRVKMKYEEEKVERNMERQQVSLADRNIVELARLASRVKGADPRLCSKVDALVEVALKVVLDGLEKIMKAADCVRLKTLKGVLDLLTPMQSVDFLAAICVHHIRLSYWNKKTNMRDSDGGGVNLEESFN